MGRRWPRRRGASHETNLLAVVNKQVDVATNNTENLERFKTKFPDKAADVRVIWKSPLIPNDPLVWRKDLSPELKKKVRDFVLAYGTGTDAGTGPDDAERADVSRRVHDGRRLDDGRRMDAGRGLRPQPSLDGGADEGQGIGRLRDAQEGLPGGGLAGVLVVHSMGVEAEGRLVYFMTVDNARFRRPVVPGDQLRFEVEVVKKRPPFWKMQAKAFVEEEMVCEAEVTAMVTEDKTA